MGDRRMKLANRFKAQVIENGKVVSETPFTPNLILDAGMNRLDSVTFNGLFTHCAIGTGNTPTEDDSGAVTATTTGTACNSSGAFFTLGDVGKLLRFDTGEKSVIAAYVDGDTVTLSDTLNVSVGTLFTMYRVNQTGLTTETKRTNTYLSGGCGYTLDGDQVILQRTFDFTEEVGDVTYSEVGFSHTATVASNLNTRGLFTGAPISVLTGQQLRVIYYFVVTVAPASPQTKTLAVSGWPAKEYPVAVDAGTDEFNLTNHGWAAGTPISFDGVTPPAPLSFGTTYYVLGGSSADYFKVEATLGGGSIDLTTAGTGVIAFTNTKGTEQLSSHSIYGISSAGGPVNITGSPTGNAFDTNEPSSVKYLALTTSSTAHATFPANTAQAQFVALEIGVATQATYVNGSFTKTYTKTFAVGDGNSSAIRKVALTSSASYASVNYFSGPVFLFDHPQEKTNLFTLSFTARISWDRDFV